MKSFVVQRVDEFQQELTALLKPRGFRKSGRTYNRPAHDGIVQVINVQAGPYEIGEPPPASVAHLRPNLYGRFTINLGAYVPEAHDRSYQKPRRTIQDYHCAIRFRFSDLIPELIDWWSVNEPRGDVITQVSELLVGTGLPLLERFSNHDDIVNNWIRFNESELRLTNTARLDVAMILLARGDQHGAKRLFEDQVRGAAHHRGHQDVVRKQALELGLGELGLGELAV